MEPLAYRMKPKTLQEFYGQEDIIGKDKLLYRLIQADKLTSAIFWGPPGVFNISRADRFFRRHAAVISPRPGPLVEPLVPLDDFAFGAAEAVSVEDFPTADTNMAGDNFFPFALAERDNFFPGNLPPGGGLYGCLLPVGGIHDSQPALRMANPPEMLGRRFFCGWHT